MSEFKKTRDVATYQKLAPPKSLQGEEDADVTWDLIVQRYPNAAPLLCQMETVIERAEGLLHQLRYKKRNDHTPGTQSNHRRYRSFGEPHPNVYNSRRDIEVLGNRWEGG